MEYQSEFSVNAEDEEDTWEPPVEEQLRLYAILDKGGIPALQFKCVGYRAPSPEVNDSLEFKEEIPVVDKSDFDFMDEVTLPKLKIRKDGEDALKGSAKKKTTSLDGVLSNMRRHNLLPSAINK
ncbi:PAXIP1-associated glutamate-rich protein 1-like [Atheta coriaria]|uniref:PAXIP1-associated glutamate-rich protein 1-like n=1 Tax=Dalotia coriaria TaxID=877792 RepID=UPI0031F36C82